MAAAAEKGIDVAFLLLLLGRFLPPFPGGGGEVRAEKIPKSNGTLFLALFFWKQSLLSGNFA